MSKKDHSEKDENEKDENDLPSRGGKRVFDVEKKMTRNNKKPRLQKHMDFVGTSGHTQDFPTMADMNDASLAAQVSGGAGALAGIHASIAQNTDDLAALAGVPAALAQNTADLAQNTADLAALAGVPAALAAVVAGLHALRDDVALANNRGCGANSHPLVPRVINGVGPLPAGFPATVGGLMSLSGLQVNVFLNHWQIPVGGGTLPERRRRLGSFLGIPVRFL